MNTTTQAPIAIIGAMAEEIKTLTAHLTDKEYVHVAGMGMTRGLLAGVPVVVMQCGIGKVNATIATTLLIERFNPQVVINTGTAGGLGEGLHVGDIVIAESIAHHDVDVTAFGYAMGQMAQMPMDYVCDEQWVERAQACVDAFPDANVHYGQIVSGDQFIASSERFSAIKQDFPNALAVEMEACAIAQTCYQFDVPFVVIRAISDLANAEANVSFEEFVEYAGKQSAEMVEKMVAVAR